MKNKKTIGYILLGFGLVFLFFAILQNAGIGLGPFNFLYTLFNALSIDNLLGMFFEGLGDVLSFIFDYFFALIIVVVGVYFAFFRNEKNKEDDKDEIDLEIERERYRSNDVTYGNKHDFRRNLDDKKIAGVCSGIAYTLGVETSVIRVVALFLGLSSSGSIFYIYLILMFVMKGEHLGKN